MWLSARSVLKRHLSPRLTPVRCAGGVSSQSRTNADGVIQTVVMNGANMKAIVDKKSNLQKGFADIAPLPHAADELLFTYQEKKDTITFSIEQLMAESLTDVTANRKLAIENEIRDKRHHFNCVCRKANELVDKDKLLMLRLKEAVDKDIYHTCVKLARDDKKRLLSQIRVDE